MKYRIEKSDEDYKKAVNYDGTDYYNCPGTIDIYGIKFITGFGSSDHVEAELIDNRFLAVIGTNFSLDYASCMLIDIMNREVAQDVYLEAEALYHTEFPNELTFFDLEFSDQFNFFGNWFQ